MLVPCVASGQWMDLGASYAVFEYVWTLDSKVFVVLYLFCMNGWMLYRLNFAKARDSKTDRAPKVRGASISQVKPSRANMSEKSSRCVVRNAHSNRIIGRKK